MDMNVQKKINISNNIFQIGTISTFIICLSLKINRLGTCQIYNNKKKKIEKKVMNEKIN